MEKHKQEWHGGTNLKEYKIWEAMKRRCYATSDKSYPNYGGRGIIVCERWIHSFKNFLEDMKQRPSDTHTIDRINNNGNYTPENCRWTTRKEQIKNRRCAHNLTFNGTTKTMLEWSNITGIDYFTLHKRIKHGWTTEDALTKPWQYHHPKARLTV